MAHVTMEMLFLYVITFIAITKLSIAENKQETTDRSLQDFCTKNYGKFEKNVKDFPGGRCTVKFQVAAANKGQARKFCIDWIPYKLISVEHESKQITCVVEGTSICPMSYVAIYESCYKLMSETKEFTRSDAENECKKDGAELLKISRIDLIEILSIFYPLAVVWIDLEIEINNIDVKEDGTSLALVFDSAPLLHVPYLSMIKLNPTEYRAMVICQKESEKSSRYFEGSLEDYNEIGFEGMVLDEVVYFPTTTHHGRKRNLGDYDKYCKSFLGSFFKENHLKHSFIPKSKSLTLMKSSSRQPHLARIGAQRPIATADKHKEVCIRLNDGGDRLRQLFQLQNDANVYDMEHGELKGTFNPMEACHSQYSTAVVLGLDKNQVYETSDAFRGPLLCGMAPPWQPAATTATTTKETTKEATKATTKATIEATIEATFEATFEATTEATIEATFEATTKATFEATTKVTTKATTEAITTAPPNEPPRRLTVNPAKRYCKPGWIFYLRPSNRAVCHGFNRLPKSRNDATWSFMQKQCQKDCGKGCFLSGFETVEEFEKIRDIMDRNHRDAVIGAYIRKECRITFGSEVMPVYDPDENSPCSRKNIFVWANNVSSNLTIIPDHFGDISDDRSGKPKEYCIIMEPREQYLPKPTDEVFIGEDCNYPHQFNYVCQYDVKLDPEDLA